MGSRSVSHQMKGRQPRKVATTPSFVTTFSFVPRQSGFHNPPSACIRPNDAQRSATPSVLSAMAAAVLVVPLFASPEARNHAQYRKFAPSTAAVAVVASLLLRPRRSARGRSTQHSSRDVNGGKNVSTLKHKLAQLPTGNGLYTGSNQAWKESKQALANDFSSNAPQSSTTGAASPSSSTYSLSYRKRNRTEGNGVEEGSRNQPAVPMDTSSVFAHMRAEFVSESQSTAERISSTPADFTDDQEGEANDIGKTASNAYAQDQHSSQNVVEPHPTLISTADIVKWFVRIPVMLLSEVVVPVVQVSSILWYDCKQHILGLQNQEERRFFLEHIEQGVNSSHPERVHNETLWDLDDIDEDRLTDEERQIMEVQRSATTAYKHLSSTVRKIIGRGF